MNNTEILLNALVKGKIGPLKIQGRDELQGTWVPGAVKVDNTGESFVVTYVDGDREIYPTKTEEDDDNSPLNEFDMGYMKLDVDSDPVAALGSPEQVTYNS